MELSEKQSFDYLLDRRLTLQQPARGYRVAIDPVFLAAAVAAKAGQHVLDAGAGTGAASLCLAWRIGGVKIDAIEIEPDKAALAQENADLNGLGERINVMPGDLADPPRAIRERSYDHVVTNPPYHDPDHVTLSMDKDRRRSNAETTLCLNDWVTMCLKRLKPRGTITMIFPARRLSGLTAALADRTGGLEIFPLWPQREEPAKRLIIRARKDSHEPSIMHAGLVLHERDGRFTPGAEAILRNGNALDLSRSR